jgi:arsenate reductase-like glutaredoxin family protein
VILEDIAGKLEEASDNWEQYLNTATGEFAHLSDGSYIETDEELADEIECSDDYVRLPNQRDIREFDIMEAFAEAAPDAVKREKLFRALRGRKPFRNFKDTIDYVGLAEAYYAFRSLELVKRAREWCDSHDIPYTCREKATENFIGRSQMPDEFDVHDFFDAVVNKNANKLRRYFEPDAEIFWSNTNERFTVDEYIRANCEYPGEWSGRVERFDVIDGGSWKDKKMVFAAKVWNAEGISARTVSFIDFGDTEGGLIQLLDEYWSDIGEPPAWRKDMGIGKRYKDEE